MDSIHTKIYGLLASKTGYTIPRIEKTVALFDAGMTIPFIARYRKEATESMDEVELALLKKELDRYRKLIERKQSILESLKENEHNQPELVKV